MNSDLRMLLINPTAREWRVGDGDLPSVRTRLFRFSMLSSLYVAAALPPSVRVRIVDEDVEPIDFDADVDVIGLSFMTFNAPRAYEIADRFRARGKTVIVGGYHASLLPEEAALHADAVCVGEAEGTVDRIIADIRSGSLQRIYGPSRPSLRGLAVPDRSLIDRGRYAPVDTVQATRGCPHSCSFCSITSFFEHRFRTRPVEEVIDELRGLRRYLLFMDDNITSDRTYALKLFRAMAPLRKRWFSQASIRIAYDDELLDAASASGCRGLFIGLESLAQENLQNWNKRINISKEYAWAISRIHAKGIGVFVGMVFGHDWDEPDVFDRTLQFLDTVNADVLQATILTPFPGTPLYHEMDSKGRITDRDWSHYNFGHVVFEPERMSREQLQAGHDRVLTEFYSKRRISGRLLRELSYLPAATVARATLPLNAAYRIRLRQVGTMAV